VRGASGHAWCGGGGELTIRGIYGRLYDPETKRTEPAHQVVWRRCFGPIPLGPNGKALVVHHRCRVTLCQRPDHHELRTGR
jgi:hypothetical protein